MTFFISPFSESSASAELNNFLKAHRIINIEKRLIDGERGTGWVFLVEYTDIEGGKSAYTMSSKVDWRDVLNPSQFAVYDLLRKTRKEIGDKTKIPLYGILSNEQLALMAQNPPKTKEEFIKIKGVNEQKFKQFGEIFLTAVQKALVSIEKAETLVSTGATSAMEKSENSAEFQLDIF
ncbi:MAG: HRDC domain-containing protein [Treponema sp.]|nr:HRDC domain-containing protein [Candidatus Treponema equifaecale]